MAATFFDRLESRLFLSGVDEEWELAVDPGISEQGVMMPMVAAPRAAAALKKGFYLDRMKIDGIPGSIVLQVSSVSATAFSGKLKSSDWGAFDVSITGKISGGTATFTGKSSYTLVKSFKGTIGVNTLAGKLSLLQNGLSVSGSFTGDFAKKAPAMADVIEPNMKGTYAIKTSDGQKISMKLTWQLDGKISGMAGDQKIAGVVLSDGRFKMQVKEKDGRTTITGARKSNGNLSGEWEWKSNDGEKDWGTFTATRK